MAFIYGGQGNTRNEYPLLDSVGLQVILEDNATKHQEISDRLENETGSLSNRISNIEGLFTAYQEDNGADLEGINNTLDTLIRKPIGGNNTPLEGTDGQALVSNGNGGTRWRNMPAHTITGLSVTHPQSHGQSEIATLTATRLDEESVSIPIYAPTAVKNPNALTILVDDETTVTYDGSAVSTVDLKPLMTNVVHIQNLAEAHEEEIGHTEQPLNLNFNNGNMTFDGVDTVNVKVIDTRVIVPIEKRVNGETISAWEEQGQNTNIFSQIVDQQRKGAGVYEPIDISFDENTKFTVDVDLIDDNGNVIDRDRMLEMIEDYNMIHRVESLTTTNAGGRLKFWCYYGIPENDVAVRIRWTRLDKEDG